MHFYGQKHGKKGVCRKNAAFSFRALFHSASLHAFGESRGVLMNTTSHIWLSLLFFLFLPSFPSLLDGDRALFTLELDRLSDMVSFPWQTIKKQINIWTFVLQGLGWDDPYAQCVLENVQDAIQYEWVYLLKMQWILTFKFGIFKFLVLAFLMGKLERKLKTNYSSAFELFKKKAWETSCFSK